MLYFTIQKRLQAGTSKVSEAEGARWRFYRRISSDILGLWSNRLSIGGSTSGIFRANLDLQDFVAGAVFVVRLEGDLTGSAHWKWRFICDADHWWHWFCVAGAVFGEVGGSFWAQYLVRLAGDFSWQAQHFVTFWEIAGTRNVVFYNTKSSPKMGRVRSRKRRVRDDDFIVGYRRIWSDVVGLSSNRLSIGGSNSGILRWNVVRGRRSIWWGCRVPLLAPRIGNDVWYVSQITGDIHFVWQAQQLVKLEAASCCSAHWKWRFICDTDHWWLAFCVAGAVFGEVGGWLYLLHAL